MYAVKVNDFVKDVVIHKYPCGHIRKRGGAPGKYGQVHWFDFETFEDAIREARIWEAIGYELKYCKCFYRL